MPDSTDSAQSLEHTPPQLRPTRPGERVWITDGRWSGLSGRVVEVLEVGGRPGRHALPDEISLVAVTLTAGPTVACDPMQLAMVRDDDE